MARLATGQKQVVRRRLLDAAAEQFARHGLAGANVDAISVAAGFAKGTLYNYFASKEALFAAVIREGAARAAESAREVAGGSTRERLTELVRADVEVLRQEEPFIRVVVREAMTFRPDTYPLVVEGLAPFLTRVTEVLDDGVAAGEIRADRPVAQMALLFVGTISLMYVQHWGSQGAWPALDDVPDLVVAAFLDGARP